MALELMAPAGSFESVVAAVRAGAESWLQAAQGGFCCGF